VWLRHAAHANDMATRLAAGLAELDGIELVGHPDGNELFVTTSPEQVARWRDLGVEFYDSPTGTHRVVRLVTSWATTSSEIDQFLEIAGMTELGVIS
jgi:threonine aldolase